MKNRGGPLKQQIMTTASPRAEACKQRFANITLNKDAIYCAAIDDGYLCWPPTLPGDSSYQQCPNTRLSDTNNIAFRTCGANGIWLDRKNRESNPAGWTNYTPCFPPDVRSLLTKVYNKEDEAQEKFLTAERTRTLEIIGYSLAFVVLVGSLVIFSRFPRLKNTRTKIHKNLFAAMTTQVFIRLVLYFDQAVARTRIAYGVSSENSWSVENYPYLCIGLYTMLECTVSSTFMWMFIEGLYLHNFVTRNCMREHRPFAIYYAIGWGLPILITGVWAVMTHFYYVNQPYNCWYGYNFTLLYWIIQGPISAIIFINFLFLINIIKVVITKVGRTESNELVKARKAVKAALVLLPLLGITNSLNMIEPPLDSVWWFRVWSYTTHFLRSFQGFFVAIIYCFMNNEVRAAITKYFEDRQAMRSAGTRRGGQSQSEHNSWSMCSCFKRQEEDLEMGPMPGTPHPSATAPMNENIRFIFDSINQEAAEMGLQVNNQAGEFRERLNPYKTRRPAIRRPKTDASPKNSALNDKADESSRQVVFYRVNIPGTTQLPPVSVTLEME
ncbi:PDF receptor isoform X2 [Plodia interpunctella]|nr:PDF receptor isoform X2 [Plodia interpunctella]